jgi:hypothetical protein
MENKEYIYGLHTVRGDMFYIGRTNDLARRMKEHIYATKGGTETKYQVMRDLTKHGGGWNYIVLAEVTENDEHYEDYYVYLYLLEGCPLTNMKAGDSVKAADREAMKRMQGRGDRYPDAKTFLSARQREVEEEQARLKTKRLHDSVKGNVKAPISNIFDWESTMFHTEKPAEKFVSPYMKERLARLGRKV